MMEFEPDPILELIGTLLRESGHTATPTAGLILYEWMDANGRRGVGWEGTTELTNTATLGLLDWLHELVLIGMMSEEAL